MAIDGNTTCGLHSGTQYYRFGSRYPVRRAAHKRRTSSRTLQGTVSALKL
jgi:hypothetical protein